MPGWPLLIWFVMLAVCFLTVMYNFDVLKAGVLAMCIVAVFSLVYVSNVEWEWNPSAGCVGPRRGDRSHGVTRFLCGGRLHVCRC